MKTYALFVRPEGSSVRRRCVARGQAASPSAFWDAYKADAASVPERLTSKYVEMEVRDDRGDLLVASTLYPEDHVTAAPTDELEPRPLARPAYEDVLEGEALEKAIKKHDQSRSFHEALEGMARATDCSREALKTLSIATGLTKEEMDAFIDQWLVEAAGPVRTFDSVDDFLNHRIAERHDADDANGAETVADPLLDLYLSRKDPSDADDVDGAARPDLEHAGDSDGYAKGGFVNPAGGIRSIPITEIIPLDIAQELMRRKVTGIVKPNVEAIDHKADVEQARHKALHQADRRSRLLSHAQGRIPGDRFNFEGNIYEMPRDGNPYPFCTVHCAGSLLPVQFP